MKSILRMNLQLFSADLGSDGGDNPEATPNEQITEIDVDSLTDEQLAVIKEKHGFKTDDDVNDIVKSKKSRWQKDLEKEREEYEKLNKMNADEKLQYQLDQQAKKIAEYEHKETLSKMSETANEMLTEKGVTVSKGFLGMLVSDNAETTSKNVKAYLAERAAQEEIIRAEFEKRLGTKIPLGSNSEIGLSRGAQLAKEQNEQNKKPTKLPWD